MIMRYAAPATPAPAIPAVRLYVERTDSAGRWLVHVGHVSERGSWRTAPHAHPKYGQIIFVRNGCGTMNLEGRAVPFAGPCVLLLPTGCVHGLDYDLDVDRWVVTIATACLSQVNGKLAEFMQMWAAPRMIPLPKEGKVVDDVCELIARLEHEVASSAAGQVVGVEALLTLLLLTLIRASVPDVVAMDSGRRSGLCLVERFRDLIEAHFRDNLSAQDYASMMAVSLTQLRAACVAASGQSPTKMIHARLITEAKRSLIFGDQSIEQIAYALGFSNASYFSRFFGKEVGQAPAQFRSHARQGTLRGAAPDARPPAAA